MRYVIHANGLCAIVEIGPDGELLFANDVGEGDAAAACVRDRAFASLCHEEDAYGIRLTTPMVLDTSRPTKLSADTQTAQAALYLHAGLPSHGIPDPKDWVACSACGTYNRVLNGTPVEGQACEYCGLLLPGA